MTRFTAPLLVLVVGTTLALHAAATAPYAFDYPGSSLDVNRTGEAVQSLSDGDFKRFFATQPAIGPVSVIVRAPFAALAGISRDLVALPERYHGDPPIALPPAIGQSQLRLYQFGVLPCLMAMVILAVFAAAAMTRLHRPLLLQLVVGGLVLALPLWDGGVNLGHPEELLTTGLTVGAVLSAVGGRPVLAAVLLGLALGSKQWAVLALPAVALAVEPRFAKRVVVIAIAVYLALIIPMALGNTDRFVDTLTAPATGSHGLVGTNTIWFQLAHHDDRLIFDGVEHLTIAHRHIPHVLERASHPFIVLVAALLSFLFWRRRPERDAAAIFQLVALIFLLRCMLDPVTNDYYHAPFLASLALYEGYAKRSLPVLTLLVTVAFLPRFGLDVAAFTRANAFYLAWSIPLATWLAVSLFRQKGEKPQFAIQPLRPKL